MPAIQPIPLFHSIVERATSNNSSLPQDTAPGAILVVCAFPVSGQYGPGSRILYYVLVATCILARKQTWLRDACLAAALLFPSVAAIHGIVLAAMHTKGAVDMDIYGAFQLLAIGVLTAPLSVRLSNTYWDKVQGRNVIFVWIILVIAGLLGLTVEFFRSDAVPCGTLPPGASFTYGIDNNCGLQCSTSSGPFSKMRQGAANNIYVIPAPSRITFGMGTLFSAACCVPAVLSLISIYFKLVESNREKRRRRQARRGEARDEGPERFDGIDKYIRGLLKVIEIPLFGAAVLAIVILGELNFWSTPVNYMTERIAAVGQWAPIAGTGLAIVATVLLRVADLLEAEDEEIDATKTSQTSDRGDNPRRPTIELHLAEEEFNRGRNDLLFADAAMTHEPDELPPSPSSPPASPSRAHLRQISTSSDPAVYSSSELEPEDRLQHTDTIASTASRTADLGRRRFANLAARLTGNAAGDRDEQIFSAAKRMLPELPGERNRNPDWNEQSARFGRHRSNSFTNSAAPSIYEESNDVRSRSRAPSPNPIAGPSRSSTLPAPATTVAPSDRIIFTTRETQAPFRTRTESEPHDEMRNASLARSMTLQPPRPTR